MSLKTDSWEGSLVDWIDFALTEYFEPVVLRDYQQWLLDQLAMPENVVPFRLVSGRAPKGRDFVRSDGTILYAADNEPLAGLWGLVAQRRGPPVGGLKDLLARGQIPGSWPPKQIPTRFSCRWGPATLRLKDRGMKIAHLLDAGRNPIPIDAEHLARRALLTLSLVNCFPMPNRSYVEFSRNGVQVGDLAEQPAVQSLLLSFLSEYLGGEGQLEPLFSAFGPGCRVALDSMWQTRAADYRFAVRPKSAAAPSARAVVRPGAARGVADGPRSFGIRHKVYPDLHAVIAELRDWLIANPGVERLDDWPIGRGHPQPYVKFKVGHLAGTDLRVERPSFLNAAWTAWDYTGVFHLNGDTKANAIRKLVEMHENGLDVDEMLEPAVTRPPRAGQRGGENPCFILVGTDGAAGLYCYPG